MVDKANNKEMEQEKVPLSKAAQYLVEECRMVLPGIQALFGFQLTAVFNQGFSEKLTPSEQRLHFLAITLLAIAIALIMTPAAYHRQTGPRRVTSKFIRIASNLLLASMAPLALSICIDFYLVGRIISNSIFIPVLATGIFAFIVALWFVLPRVQKKNGEKPRA
jgi:hypothetical protein